jgi:hypothetical protein
MLEFRDVFWQSHGGVWLGICYLHHWRTPAALTAQSGIPRGMPLCCSNRTPPFPKGRSRRMISQPTFSNEAGTSGVSSRNPLALTIHLAWSEARLVRNEHRPSWVRRRLLRISAYTHRPISRGKGTATDSEHALRVFQRTKHNKTTTFYVATSVSTLATNPTNTDGKPS